MDADIDPCDERHSSTVYGMFLFVLKFWEQYVVTIMHLHDFISVIFYMYIILMWTFYFTGAGIHDTKAITVVGALVLVATIISTVQCVRSMFTSAKFTKVKYWHYNYIHVCICATCTCVSVNNFL